MTNCVADKLRHKQFYFRDDPVEYYGIVRAITNNLYDTNRPFYQPVDFKRAQCMKKGVFSTAYWFWGGRDQRFSIKEIRQAIVSLLSARLIQDVA